MFFTKDNLIRKIRKVAIFLFVFINVLGMALAPVGNVPVAMAATYTFTQTDWAGGATSTSATHTSNQTGWTSASTTDSNVKISTAGQLTLEPTISTTASFDYSTTTGYFCDGITCPSASSTITGGVAKLVNQGGGASTWSEITPTASTTALYHLNANEGVELAATTTGAVGIWHMNSSSGTTATDSSSSGINPGTVSEGITWTKQTTMDTLPDGWALYGSASTLSGGIATVPAGQNFYYLESSVVNETASVLEARVQVAGSGTVILSVRHDDIGSVTTADYYCDLYAMPTYVQLCGGATFAVDTSVYHTYRIVSSNQTASLYIDNALVISNQSFVLLATIPNGFRWGNLYSGSGTTYFDYVRYYNGVADTPPAWSTAGKFSNTLSFDGVDDYVTTPITTTLQNFTVEAWVNPQSTTGDIQEIVSKRSYCATATTDFPFSLFLNPSGTQASVIVDSGNDYNTDLSVSSVTFTAGQWHHIAATYNSSILTIYVDGVGASVNGSVTLSNNTGRVYTIGRSAYVSSPGCPTSASATNFKGLIDEVAVWNTALATTTIQEHYNRGVAEDATTVSTAFEANDGTTFGPTSTSSQTGLGEALSFDGVDDYVDAGSGASLDITGTLTVEGWVYITDLSGFDAIVDMAQEGTTIENYSIFNANGALYFQYYNGGWQSLTVSNFFATSTWTHVAVTYDNGTITAYKNGVQAGQATGKPALVTNTANVLKIGRYQVGSQGYFSGLIDEVAVWNTALPAATIATHATSTGGTSYIPSSGATVTTATSSINSAITAYTSFTVASTTPANTDIQFQVSTNGGTTWKYWSGSAWTATTTAYSPASTINTNIGSLATSTSDQFKVRAKLTTTAAGSTPQLDNISVGYNYDSSTLSGTLVSSAYNTTGAESSLSSLSWDKNLPSAGTTATTSLRTASTLAGLASATWYDFSSSTAGCTTSSTSTTCGSSVLNTISSGALTDGVNDQWLQYRVQMSTTNVNQTPTVSEVRVGYNYGSSPITCTNVGGTVNTTCEINNTQTLSNGATIVGSGSLVIKSGGNLTAAAGNTFYIDIGGNMTIESGGTITGNFNATSTDFTINSGGSINVNGKGYAGGAGGNSSSGSQGSSGNGGGGYGGSGGSNFVGGGGSGGSHANSSGSGGTGLYITTYYNGGVTNTTVYGSPVQPVALGSGGGGGGSGGGPAATGGAGGGAIKIIISGILIINGPITANGSNGSSSSDYNGGSGGGSGGSIWLQANTIQGNNSITANGGAGGAGVYSSEFNYSGAGGGGAGGRIAVFYYSTNNHTGSITATGGANATASGSYGQSVAGAAGTIQQAQIGVWDGGGSTNNWSEAANWTGDTLPTSNNNVIFNNTSVKNSTVDASFAGAIANLNIASGYTGTTTLSRSLTVSGNATSTAGTFNANGQTMSVTGLTTINGGTYQASTATQTFTGGLTVSSGTFTGSSGAVSVPGTLTLSGGTFTAPSGTFTIGGNFTNNGGTFTPGTGTVTFNGSGAQVINGTAASQTFNNVTVNKPTDTLSVSGSTATVNVSGALTVTSGTYDASGKVTNVTGLTTINGGTYQASTATQTFTGGLTVSSGTFTGSSGAVSVPGTLTLSGGTFTAPSGTFTVGGNFTKNGGTFTPGTGTVTLNGTNQTISGANTFYNLTKNVTATSTLTFPAGATTTIAGTLNLSGVATGKLLLRSLADGTPWKIDAQGGRTMNNLDVKDSNNVNATKMDCLDGCDDSTGNTNWRFGAAGEFDPTFGANGVSVSQIATSTDPNWGKVKVEFKIKDLSVMPAGGWVTIGFTYSTSSGATWNAIPSGDLTSGDADGIISPMSSSSNPAFSNSAWATSTVYWSATSTVANLYSTTTLMKVTISDGDKPANAPVDGTSTIAVLDTYAPGLGAASLKVNGSSTDSLIVANTGITLSLQNITGDASSETIYVQFASSSDWWGANANGSLSVGTWGSGFSVASSTDGSITWPWTMSSTTETITARLRDSFNNNQAATDTIQVQNTAAPGVTASTFLKINDSTSTVDIATSTAPTVTLSLQGITGDASNETIYVQFSRDGSTWYGANSTSSLAAVGSWGSGFTVASSSEPTWQWTVQNRSETIRMRVKDNFDNLQATIEDNIVRWNNAPDFQSQITSSQITNNADANWGKVKVDYIVRDRDTSQNSSSTMQNFAQISLQYSTGTPFTTWTNILRTYLTGATGTQVSSTVGKIAITESYPGASSTVYWNASGQLGNYAGNAQVRVTIDDTETIFNSASSTSATISNLDAERPSFSSFTAGSLNSNNVQFTDADSDGVADNRNVTLRLNNLVESSSSTQGVYVLFSNDGTNYGTSTNSTTGNLIATSTQSDINQWLRIEGANVGTATTSWTLLQSGSRSKTVYFKIKDVYNNEIATPASTTITWNKRPQFSASTISDTAGGLLATSTSGAMIRQCNVYDTSDPLCVAGKIKVIYAPRDPDANESGLATKGQLSTTFEYATSSGVYTSFTISGFATTTVATSSADVAGGYNPIYSTTTTYWNAASVLSSGNVLVRVTVNDNEAGANIASSTSNTIAYDKTNPAGGNITFDAGVAGSTGSASVTIGLPSDTNTRQYLLADDAATHSSASTTAWTNISTTSTISWTFDSDIEAKTLKFQYRDIYGNTTATTTVSTAVPPAGDSFLVQDISKTSTNDWKLYISWQTSTSSLFASYKLEYATSTDNTTFGSYNDVTVITASSTNYYVHGNLNNTLYYRYRVGVKDTNNNISVRSNAYINAKPDGVQNLGEGGGGSAATASKVENVVPTQAADKTVTVTYKLTDSSLSSKTSPSYEAYLLYNTGIILSSSTASTITVSNSSKMSSSGYIQINNEVIRYGTNATSTGVLGSLTRGTWPTAGTSRATRQNTIFFEGTPVWIKATSTTPVSITNSTISSGQSGTISWDTYYESSLAGSSYANIGIRVLVHDNQGADSGPLSSQSDYSEIGTLVTLDLTAPTIQFSATSTSGAESATSTSLSLILSRAYPYNATANYAVSASSTASGSGVDYTLSNGTATITAGATSTSITLLIANEALNEPDETVILTLSSPANSSLGANTTHTYTILNDDGLPTVGFITATSSASESVATSSFAVFLSATSGRDVTINFSVGGGSATSTGANPDYATTSSSVSLTIPAGSQYATATASIINDSNVEDPETLILNIASVTNATTTNATTTHTYTILDDDSAPIAGFSASSASSSEATSPVTLSFTLAAATINPVTINYSVSGGGATAGGVDYATTSSSVVILAGSTATSTTFTVNGDSLDENDETIIFSIGNVTNATTTGGIGAYTYTILDDDALPVISFALATSSVSEASSTTSIAFSLSATSSKDVTASFGLSGTATSTGANADYSFATTTVTIPAGSVSTSTTATIVNDTLNEGDEMAVLTLANPVNATIGGTTSHTLTITDDDGLPTIGFASSTSSGSEASSTVSLLIQLSATSSKDVTVGYAVATSSSTASSGVDYVAGNGTATISAGSISTTVTAATVINDTLNEASETIVAALSSSPTNAALSATSTHTYTILDDENVLTVQFINTSSSGLENSGSASIGIVLSAVSSQDVTVSFSLSGTATSTGANPDYATTSSLVVIPAGSTATSTTITLNNESLVEGNETVILQISGATNASVGTNSAHTFTIIDDETTAPAAVVSNIVAAQQSNGSVQVNYNVKDTYFSNKAGPSYQAYLFYGLGATLPASAYSSASGTLAVSDASKMPSSGYVQVGKEVLSYSGKSGNVLSGVTRAVWLSSGRYTATSTSLVEGSPVWTAATSTMANLIDTGSISSGSGLNAAMTWNTATDTILSGNYLSGVGIRVLVHDNQAADSGPLSSQNGSSNDSTLALLDLKAPVLGASSLLINSSAVSIEATGTAATLSLASVSGDAAGETIYIQFATSSLWFGALSGGGIGATSSDWGDATTISALNSSSWTWPVSGRSEVISVRIKDAYGNSSSSDTNSIIKNAVPEFSGSVSDSDAAGYATTTNSNVVIRQCNIYDTDVNCTAGKVKIKFLTRDPDAGESQLASAGKIKATLEFSLNGGAYSATTTTTYSATGTNALAQDAQAGTSTVSLVGATSANGGGVSESANYDPVWTTMVGYYDPGIASSATLAARVSVTDNESGTTPVTATSNTIAYDKTAPSCSLSSCLLTFDGGIAGSSTTATITIPLQTDANAVQYTLSATTTDGTTASTTAWTTFALPASVSWGFDSVLGVKSVNYSFRDVYGNQSGTGTASSLAPISGASFTVDDITASSTKRVFLSWPASAASDFANYRLEYATSTSESSGYGAWLEATQVSNISNNYYTHSGLDQTLWYRYRLSVKNSAGNYSVKTVRYSNTYSTSSPYITAKPDGVLNGDEASANDTVAPTATVVTSIVSSDLQATLATIRFTVSDNASSQLSAAIYYSASSTFNSAAAGREQYAAKYGVAGYINTGSAGSSTSTSVTLVNLNKNTAYKYGVEVCDITGNCAFYDNGDAGYDFTTTPGPAFVSGSFTPSNGAMLATYDTAAITWQTDGSGTNPGGDSQVFYSATSSGSDLINPTTAGNTTEVTTKVNGNYPHSVTLSGLNSNTRYYYKIRSTDRTSSSVSYLQYAETGMLDFTTGSLPNVTISNATCQTTDTTLTARWTTNLDSTTEVSVLSGDYVPNNFFSTSLTPVAQYPTSTMSEPEFVVWRSSADYGKDHTYTASNLTASTNYRVRIRSTNRSGNGGAYDFSPCATQAAPAAETIIIRPPVEIKDITPPIISAIAIKDITADTAVIAWGTNELADSLVEYGPTMNYGSLSGSTKEFTSAHTVTVSGLKPATNYNFKVSSADAKGNRAYAGDQSFTTMSMEEESLMAKDELEALKKELEELKEKAESDAKKAATLQEAAKRFKEILKTISSDVSLQDLEELTTDISDTIEDITQQIIPPAIIGGVPSIEVGSDKATIKWRTNKPSNSLVALSSEVDYNPKAQNPYIVQVGQPNEEVTAHTVVIPNLSASTVYHFQIRSKAKVGPEGKSKDFVFETLPELPQIVDYSFKRITENSITVAWKTNTLTTSLVRYTPLVNNKLVEEESKTQGKPDFVKDHEVTISNLPANANFLIEISSADVTGATASRTIGTVKTAIDVKAPVIGKVRSESTLFPGKTERTQTIIYWETDEPSTSQIFWKEGVAKGDMPNVTPLDKELTTSHVIVITTFKSGLVYRFQVESVDPTGNKTRSSDYTVLTPRKGETVIDLIITNFEDIFGFLKKL